MDDAPATIAHTEGLNAATCFREGDLDEWSPGVYALEYDELDRKEVAEVRPLSAACLPPCCTCCADCVCCECCSRGVGGY
jgi:hypothetical protein